MSVVSAPAFVRDNTPPDLDFEATPQTAKPPKSVAGVEPSRFENSKTEGRRRNLTEKGLAYQLETKLANRNSALKKLKQQMDKVNMLRDTPETTIEQLDEERFHLDRLKDAFNDAFKEHDDLLLTEKEKEDSYRWFDIRDREFTECRIRLCERMQVLERKSSRAPSRAQSVKSGHSMKSKASERSKASSSSTKHLSLALLDAAAKAAKLQAEMEFFEKEKELRRLQLEKELAIASAEEKAIKRILQEDRLAADKEVSNVEGVNPEVKQELKPDLSDQNIKKERSFSANPYAPEFVPTNYSTPPFEPPRAEHIFTPRFQENGVNTTLQEIVSLQAKQAELSSLIINQQKISNLPVKEPPVFSGDYFEYPAFVTAFDSIICSNVPSNRDRLYFLDKYTKGKANNVVKGFLAMSSDSAYERARKMLDQRFGNPVHVAEAYKSSLRSWSKINDGDSSGLQDFSDFLVRCEEAMKTMQSMGDLDSTETLRLVSSKLPSYSAVKWCRHAHETQTKSKKIVTFSALVKFVRGEAELANDPIFSPDALKAERKKTGAQPKWGWRNKSRKKDDSNLSANSFATAGSPPVNNLVSSSKPSADQNCPLCNARHDLVKCSKFLKSSVDERSEVIRSKGLCYGCFKSGHVSSGCRNRSICKECGRRHHTLLHGVKPRSTESSPQPEPKSQETQQTSSKNESLGEKPPVTESASSHLISVVHSSAAESASVITNCRIIQVILFHKDNTEKAIKVYALLDDASDTTFVTTQVQRELGIKGVQTSLDLSTMLGRQRIAVERIDGLVVQRLDKRTEIELPKTYARETIPSRRDQIPRPEIVNSWPHLRKIQGKIPPYDEDVDIGLLIGCNCPKAIKPTEVIRGKGEEPYAVRTSLGWSIVGPVATSNTPQDGYALDSTCHRILSREVISGASDNANQLSFVFHGKTKEVINPSAISQMFELDFLEHKGKLKHGLSKEDREFIQIAERGIQHREDGHYELPLPLKNETIEFPNNKTAALRRLSQLKRRFVGKNGQQYYEHYVEFMKKLIENGYAESVPEIYEADRSSHGQGRKKQNVWYIPHHGVYHPKKPNKIRVVFDCAAEYESESLNKHLLQGPDLTNNLAGVLCRFRQEPIAFMCDIEAMFHQVKVNEEYRDLLRFLWWEDGDLTKEPKEYRMTVHLFGATSSPGCANFALKSTANDFEEEFGASAADFLRNDFYVDDGLKSVPFVDEAVKLIASVKQMCSKGGFRLHKFVSNSKEVIRRIPEQDRADGVKELDLDLDSLPLERALGVHWCVESDCFQFTIVLQDKPCTRRGILSTVSSIFDPLGFVAPLLLDGKSILQELCRREVGWDDPIPDEVKVKWERWRSDLLEVQRISIPRCYKPDNFGRVVNAQLHHFSDASVKGYGQCSYLRLVDENQKVHCSFVMGKSRVAPLKPVTIPRLELTAAVCSVRISQQLRRELEYTIDQEYFWTDSKVVLGYIANESRRFHVFVANRVQEIQENTSVDQWKYVESKQNPADEASRGLKTQELLNCRWITGPEFLWENENQSINNGREDHEVQENDPEVKKSVAMATTTTTQIAQAHSKKLSLAKRVEYFSDWYRAKRAVALCQRYIRVLKDRVLKKQCSHEEVQGLDVSDLKTAECAIIRDAQIEAFEEEIVVLQKMKQENTDPDSRVFAQQRKANMKKSSSLYKLDPFLDVDGIVRVGGRLRRASLTDDIKFPIILPRNSHVTKLIIKHFHERTHHQGKGMTLNEVRSNGFWVVSGPSVVANMISSCVKCQRLRGAVQEQRMSDLPEDRLECTPPFTYCAVDYFGPFIVKDGRKELKRYGVLFTCMASRAVHIETANSLETDSFINALRRFISRRGPIRQLRSDQGTNFVGARTELAQALAEMDQEKIRTKLLEEQCDWFSFKMNVPAASHMGGVWERQIRSARNVLSSLLLDNGKQLDDESLRTLMCEAEAIVNSRPLTVNQLADPDSSSPLTPNHLLTMKSKVVLAPPGAFQPADMYCRKRWRRVAHLANEFWTRWRKEFLLSLQQRQKWTRPRRNLIVDDVVMIKDENLPRSVWQLARVSAVYPSSDGQVRKVQVALADSCLDNKGKRIGTVRYLERPVQKLVLLMSASKDE